MKFRLNFTIIILSCLINISTIAEALEITLENGDKINAEIIEETDTTLKFSHKSLGIIEIDRSKAKLPLPKPVNPITWKRELAASYNRSQGNTESDAAAVEVSINRHTKHNEISAEANITTSSSNEKTDSQKWYTMGRYAFSFGERLKWYNFYKSELDHDKFAKIDYRLIPSTGIGYWYSDKAPFKAMSEIAIGIEHIEYNDNTDATTEGLLIPQSKIEWNIFGNNTLSQEIRFFLTADALDDYRAVSKTCLNCPVGSNTAIKLSYKYEYTSEPAGNAKKADKTLATSLAYSF